MLDCEECFCLCCDDYVVLFDEGVVFGFVIVVVVVFLGDYVVVGGVGGVM